MSCPGIQMIRFVKAHAYGNDFLYVRADAVDGVRLDAFARELCNRHTGIGADGLIIYEPKPDGASMRLFNADGGRAEVSGNGVRALGALLLNGIEPNAPVSREIIIHTEAGPKMLTLVGLDGARQMFRAAMGAPHDLRQISVSVDGEALSPIVMDMGNPQAILLGPLPDVGRFHRIGGAIQQHPSFPAGTNLEFAEVEALDRVRILIWERGVGPTTSSGTGSCAALVAAAAFGGASRIADVVAPGGAQRVEWQDDSVYLTGWAEVLCSGEWHRQVPRTS
jgi:diaminopimelate epimerase